MNAHLLELSDHALRLSNGQGALISSPGFATVEAGAVLYGEAARARFRLHPRDSFNQFWYQLSQEPLRNPNPHFRHYADLAYGQLSALTRDHASESELVLALPGHYNRDQAALVLGLLKHCPVAVTGLVDQGVLAAACSQHAPVAVYLELQLHQAVLTHVQLQDNHVTRSRVQQIPGAGLLALNDAWAGMIADAFIKQSRFNPQHTATTEQYIHDQLQPWMETALIDNEVQLEINHKGTLYQATVLRSHFEQKSRQLLSRITKELEGSHDYQLLVPEPVAVLPGAGLWLPEHDCLNSDTLIRQAFSSLDYIRQHSVGRLLLTSLPSAGVSAPAVNTIANNRHLLIGHRTWAIPAGGQIQPGSDIALDAGLPASFSLDCGDPLSLLTCPSDLLLNEAPASVGQRVNIGDRIGFTGSDVSLQIIEVG